MPYGQRITQLGFTAIARMYHSTACLTTNGTVIVAGCDRCYKIVVEPNWAFSPSPTSKAEYRVEIFSPPYFYMYTQKPAIMSVDNTILSYNAVFRVQYDFPDYVGPGMKGNGGYGAIRVTRAVLVAPCSCTHSYNTHQRLVGLRITGDNTISGLLTLRAPPDANVAPPGMYMLFLLSGDVYSKAVWVTLRRNVMTSPPPADPNAVYNERPQPLNPPPLRPAPVEDAPQMPGYVNKPPAPHTSDYEPWFEWDVNYAPPPNEYNGGWGDNEYGFEVSLERD